jgi:hypothetical protein
VGQLARFEDGDGFQPVSDDIRHPVLIFAILSLATVSLPK